jgi:catechol 2,3-dioxygenase
MPVLGLYSVTLEVPSLDEGIKFYTDAGFVAASDEATASFSCPGQDRTAITLVAGVPRKRLHHIALRAVGLEEIAANVHVAGGQVVEAPARFEADGLWVRDPHGMLIHLVERPRDPELAPVPPFEINAPGRLVRKRRAAVAPLSSYPAVTPLRLGHVLLFSPDVPRSVAFVVEAFGMGLADRAQDVIAFCCVRKQSDHHVVAFAKSPSIGFHHASFQVEGPDEVGRGGAALMAKAGRGDWGFGRHTIGSNFFHYIQDPWGSWFEYYSDMDHIDDYASWIPTNYAMEDSLANWGPALPDDFVHNYEADTEAYTQQPTSGE